MFAAVANLASARYRKVASAEPVAKLHLLEGLPDDRSVSAFLDPLRFRDQLWLRTRSPDQFPRHQRGDLGSAF